MRYNLKKIIPGIVLASVFLSMAPVGAPSAQAQFDESGFVQANTAQQVKDNSTRANAEAQNRLAANSTITCSSVNTCLLLLVYWAGPGIAGGVVYIGAVFFSIVVQLSLNSTAYALDFLSTGWTTVRDIANMAFIFILIYIAIMVMLSAETSGTIKTLAVVVVIALLVNFSFFFTRIVIDAGNIVAVQFYNAIPNEGPYIGNGTKDLSLSIMGAVNPQQLLSANMLAQAQKMTGTGGTPNEWGGMAVLSVVYLSVAAIFWILFFAFLQVGIKFMLRIVGLWFVLIASPLAFVAQTMPQTKHFFKQWLDYLIKFSFYPAIFLFMYWILTKFATSVLASGGNGTLMSALSTTNVSDQVGTMATIATVMIRMGFVVAVLYVGLKVSDWIVKEGSGIAGAVTGKVSGAIGGSAKWAGRTAGGYGYSYTLGALAQRDINNMKKNPPKGRIGQYLDYTWRNKVLAPIAGKSFGSAPSYKDVEKTRKERKTDWNENIRDDENRKLVARAKPIIEKNIAAGEKAESGIDAKDLERLQALDKRQIGSLNADNIKILSHVFTEGQNKVTKDLEKLTDREKDESHTNWENHSPHASVRQAQKEIELLRDINTKLGGIPALTTTLAAGITIKDSSIKVLKDGLGTKLKEVTKKFEDARLARDTATMAELSATRQAANDGLGHVKELEKKFEKTGRTEIISPK